MLEDASVHLFALLPDLLSALKNVGLSPLALAGLVLLLLQPEYLAIPLSLQSAVRSSHDEN